MERPVDADWKELSELLDTALELPPEARAAWLESLEVRDAALKERLRALLARAAQVETHDFMRELPKLALTQQELAALQPSEQAGDIVGAYRLVRELGSGGMSSVWLAERVDGLINRPVALKLPQGLWRRGELAERFARERQVLAALTHPHIARLYDTGVTASGQPFLALEYVEGKPINVYCEERSADTRERVRLCLQVARAVAFAHSRLIVHRDLKPANILVTAEGYVRLLDFGIAKLLDPEHAAERTEISQLAFTPDYASPEQIAGGPVSTASDVYSLGVVLYELLTGRKPYTLARGDRATLERAVLSAEPPRPSAVAEPEARARELRGDLDTIALKALKKVPEERYASVAGLADDLERYLSHRPVLARPDSTGYRLRKFILRNKLAVGAAASLFAVIIAGAGAALWQARVARDQAQRAEEFREFLASTIRDADPRQGEGRVLSAAALLRQALDRTASLDARPEMRVEMLSLISSSLLNLEDFAGAEEAARKALIEGERALGPDHPLTLRARMAMIGVHRFRGRTDDMRRELAAVERTLTAAGEISDADRFFVLESRGHLAIDAGDSPQAVKSATEALELASTRFGERDARTAAAAVLLGEAYEYSDVTPQHVLETAERGYRLTVALHPTNDRHPQIITARDVYGRALARAGNVDEGLAQLERALADGVEVLGSNSATVAFLSGNTALYQRGRGRIHEALANLDRAIDIHGRNVSHQSFTYLSPLSGRGITRLTARLPAQALPDLEQASRGLRELFGPEHEEAVIAEWNRALALACVGRFEESRAAFEQPLREYRGRYKSPVYLPYRALVAAATARRLEGDFDGARSLALEAMASFGPDAEVTRQYVTIFNELGFAALGQEQPRQARFEFGRSLQLLNDPAKPVNPAQADTLLGLGRAELALGNRAAARQHLRNANAYWLGFDAGNPEAAEVARWMAKAR